MFARSLKPIRFPEPMMTSAGSLPMANRQRSLIGTSSPPVHLFPQDPKEKEGVELLLGIANIVSKEIASSDTELFDDDNDDYFRTAQEKTPFSEPSIIFDERLALTSPPRFPSFDDEGFSSHRIRSVSIDNEFGTPRRTTPRHNGLLSKSTSKPKSFGLLPAVVTPVGKKRLRPLRKLSLKVLATKAKKEQIKFPKITDASPQNQNLGNLPNIMSLHKRKATGQRDATGKSITTIYRKKFSWKNYPELEAFLVANREEYLRHSALNYTIQQKKYNNRLTERLLDLAAEHLYVFNEDEFSFVTVRDRIRCFYKSYVQSSKKRGIVLGYAARKAGILTAADLQKSARKEGTIITPH